MISPIAAMIPPAPPNLSQAALTAQVRSIDSHGMNLAVPRVQLPPPPQIALQPMQVGRFKVDLRG
ncbi:MAG TPA: hypothetical protein VFS62_15575 [Chloroflexota bacterium]|jgi:hypothetical protein|nr:hypothetical protein [Chloroflexota bacterium]